MQRHGEIKFELPDLAARALNTSVVRDEPQIYPGRSADDEETEGMSAPTKECGDLQIRNICGSIKLIASWTGGLRILDTFFPMSVKRRKYISMPAWTKAVTSFPFVVSCDALK